MSGGFLCSPHAVSVVLRTHPPTPRKCLNRSSSFWWNPVVLFRHSWEELRKTPHMTRGTSLVASGVVVEALKWGPAFPYCTSLEWSGRESVEEGSVVAWRVFLIHLCPSFFSNPEEGGGGWTDFNAPCQSPAWSTCPNWLGPGCLCEPFKWNVIGQVWKEFLQPGPRRKKKNQNLKASWLSNLCPFLLSPAQTTSLPSFYSQSPRETAQEEIVRYDGQHASCFFLVSLLYTFFSIIYVFIAVVREKKRKHDVERWSFTFQLCLVSLHAGSVLCCSRLLHSSFSQCSLESCHISHLYQSGWQCSTWSIERHATF